MITAGELLHGSDEDVVVNLYLALLGRWPDEAGYEHHLAFLAGRPERRREAFERIRGSEEGRLRNRPVDPDPSPVPAERALAAQLRLRTAWFREEINRLATAPAVDAPLLEEVTALRLEVAELRREAEERLARLETGMAGPLPEAPALSTALSVGYVNDLIELLRAELLARIRAIEARQLDAKS
jgi:phosphatidylserine/phosphatidylglycerophosphate/cardiolipin synthase-like enzyme